MKKFFLKSYDPAWFFFSYKGRIKRLPFFLGIVGLSVLSVLLGWIMEITGPVHLQIKNLASSSGIYALALISFVLSGLWAFFALSVKRLHDCGRSGWFCLLYLVNIKVKLPWMTLSVLPVLSALLFLYLLFKKSAPVPPPDLLEDKIGEEALPPAA